MPNNHDEHHGQRVDIHFHFPEGIHINVHDDHGSRRVLLRLDEIAESINSSRKAIMATAKELVTLSQTVVDEVSKFPAAVNALEAAVTAALAKLPSVPPDVQADIDAAFANMTGVLATAQGAIADAADGVDEVTVPPVEPAP